MRGLARTASSLAAISNSNGIEWVIVDGCGGEALHELECVAALSSIGRVDVISEPDHGIYDAMNKGMRRAAGDHVWFLNAGDEAVGATVDYLNGHRPPACSGVMFGYVRVFGRDREGVRTPRGLKYLWHGMPTSHQAIIYPLQPLRLNALNYSTLYAICGDYHFTLLASKYIEFGRNPYPLARFFVGGKSTTQWRPLLFEPWHIQRAHGSSGVVLRLASLLLRMANTATLRGTYWISSLQVAGGRSAGNGTQA